jgi:hydroxylaminobenzene mutase
MSSPSNSSMSDIENANLQRSVMFWGMILFLLGMVLAFGFMPYTNKRMGVAVHLEGVTNGTFMVVVALIWNYFHVPARAKKVAYYSIFVGSYFNWFGTLLAALWGAGAALSPVLGAGYVAAPWQESVIGVVLPVSGLAEILCVMIILWGLRRRAK